MHLTTLKTMHMRYEVWTMKYVFIVLGQCGDTQKDEEEFIITPSI